MLQKMRDLKKSRRGFTLVEIIVVLVILAILAAFTIPAMLGYIRDAQAKADLAEARSVMIAAQAATSEAVGTNQMAYTEVNKAFNGKTVTTIEAQTDVASAKFKNLLGSDATVTNTVTTFACDANGKITNFVYTTSRTTQTYDGSKWTSVGTTPTTTTKP